MGNVILLSQDSIAIKHLCKVDKRLSRVINAVGDISYVPHEDPYVFIVHEIIEQMLSVKAANVIYSRLVSLCDGKLTAEAISRLSDAEIKSVGTANSKVQFIRSITDVVRQNDNFFYELEALPDEDVFNKLTSIRGIGPWTAKMYLLFVLNRQDILPVEDVAFQQSYKWLYKTTDVSPASIKRKCQKWKPYSSIAARYLYRALDMGFTKNEFHLYKQIQ